MKKIIITVSRQYGSGGHDIAKAVAKALDIPFYDNEIITLAAKESGMSKELFSSIDETASHSLLYSLTVGAYGYGGNASAPINKPINDQLFYIQTKIIKDLAKIGSCVIVGRCADYILQDESDCINIFIHSSMEKRIANVVRSISLSEKTAQEVIKKTDRRRASYHDFYSTKKWGVAENYDLCIDVSKLNVEQAAAIIRCAAEQRMMED